MNQTTKWILEVIVVVGLMLAVFFLGRNSHKPADEIKLPDVSKYQKSIDSADIEIAKLKSINKRMFISFDSLKQVKINNVKKVNHGIKEVNNFTPTTRQLWNDSVLKSAGLK